MCHTEFQCLFSCHPNFTDLREGSFYDSLSKSELAVSIRISSKTLGLCDEGYLAWNLRKDRRAGQSFFIVWDVSFCAGVRGASGVTGTLCKCDVGVIQRYFYA